MSEGEAEVTETGLGCSEVGLIIDCGLTICCWCGGDVNTIFATFCLPGLGAVAFLFDAGLDRRLLLGLARFACAAPGCLSCFPAALAALPLPGKACCPLLLPPALLLLFGRFRLGGACPIAFKVVGFRPCWSNPLLRLGCLGGKGMFIFGGKRPAIEAFKRSGERLISEGSVLGGRLVGVSGWW